jgi:hypothetical protein
MAVHTSAAREEDDHEGSPEDEAPADSGADLDEFSRQLPGQQRQWLEPAATVTEKTRGVSPPGPAGEARNPSPRKGRSRTDTMVHSEAANVVEELAKMDADLDALTAQERILSVSDSEAIETHVPTEVVELQEAPAAEEQPQAEPEIKEDLPVEVVPTPAVEEEVSEEAKEPEAVEPASQEEVDVTEAAEPTNAEPSNLEVPAETKEEPEEPIASTENEVQEGADTEEPHPLSAEVAAEDSHPEPEIESPHTQLEIEPSHTEPVSSEEDDPQS